MKKNAVDFILRFADEQGKIRRNVIVKDFLDKFDSLLDQVESFEKALFSIDFKLMNGIKTSIQFHLAGIRDLFDMEYKNKIIPYSKENHSFDIKVYALYSELLKLIDAIICDLRSGFEYIDLIGLRNTIEYVCKLFNFIKEKSPNELTGNQERIINEKLYDLINLYNSRLSFQIFAIETNKNWIAAMNAVNYQHYLMISNMLDCSNYELINLRNCKINLEILQLEKENAE